MAPSTRKQKRTARKRRNIIPLISEWEWGWKAPLLFRLPPDLPPEIGTFLTHPLSRIGLSEAGPYLEKRLAELRTTRIGIRFERIQECLFRFHPGTESLRSGLVIPGKTEIDLLHRIHTLPHTTIHWEVAVKFYLAVDAGGSADPDRWIGPGQKDSLGNKTRTIFNRQLSVLRDPAVRASIGIPETEKVLAIPKIHGVLFSPFGASVSDTLRPSEISPEGARGVSLPIHSLRDFIAGLPPGEGTCVRWLKDRQDWIRFLPLTSAECETEEPLKSFFNSNLESMIQSHFAENGDPIQGAVFSREVGNERSELRFFIVPEDWQSKVEGALETMRAKSRIT